MKPLGARTFLTWSKNLVIITANYDVSNYSDCIIAAVYFGMLENITFCTCCFRIELWCASYGLRFSFSQ